MNWAHQVGINYTLTVVATAADAALRKDAQIRQSALRTQVTVQRAEEKTRREAQQTASVLEMEGKAWERLGARAVKAAAEKRKAAESVTDPKEAARLRAEAEAWERVAQEARGAGVEKEAASEAGGADAGQLASLRAEAATYEEVAEEARKAALAKRQAASKSTNPEEIAALEAEAQAWENLGKEALQAEQSVRFASSGSTMRNALLNAGALKVEANAWDDVGDEALQAAVKTRIANMGMKETSRAAEDIAKKLGGPGGVGGSIFKVNQGFAFFRNTISMIKWPAIISMVGLAIQALSALAAGAVALVQSMLQASNAVIAFTAALAPAAGAIMAYPAILSVALQSIGSFVLALGGLKDAMKEQQTGLSAVAQASLQAQGATLGYQSALKAQRQALIQSGAGSLEYKQATLGVAQAQAQATQAEKALADARRASNAETRAFAKFLDQEAKPALISLQQTAAHGLLPGLTEGLRGLLGGPLFRTVQEGIAKQAAAMGNMIQESAAQLNTPRIAANFKAIFATNTMVSRDFARGLTDLAKAATELLVAAQPLTRWFGTLVRQFGAWAASSARAGRESGRLTAFFERTRRTLTALGNILANVSVALINTFSAGREQGESMLASLERVTLRWREWTESITGRNRLDRYFERSSKAAATWGRMLRDFFVAVMNIFHESSRAGQTLAESLADAATGFRKMTETVEGKQSIRKFFADAIPPLMALGRLFSGLLHAFIRLGQSPGLAKFVDTINQRLVPAVERMVRETNEAFGPALAEALTQIATLIADLASPNGPMTMFVRTLGLFVEAIDKLINAVPGLRTAIFNLVGALAVFRAASAFLSVGRAALGTGVLAKMFSRGGGTGAASVGAATAAARGGGIGAVGSLGMAALAGAGLFARRPVPTPMGSGTTTAGGMEAFGQASLGSAATGAGAAAVLREAAKKAGLEAATETRKGMLAGLRQGLSARLAGLGGAASGVGQGLSRFGSSRLGMGTAIGVTAAGYATGFLPDRIAPPGGLLSRLGSGVAQGATIGAIGGTVSGVPGGTAIGALAGATIGATKALYDYQKAVEAATLATRRGVGGMAKDIATLKQGAGELRLTLRDARLQQRAAEEQLKGAQDRFNQLVAQGAPKEQILIAQLDVDIAQASFDDATRLLGKLKKQLKDIQDLVGKKIKWELPKGWREWVKTFEQPGKGPGRSDRLFRGTDFGSGVTSFLNDIGIPFGPKEAGIASEGLKKMAAEAEKVLRHSKGMPEAYRRTAAAIKLAAQEAEQDGRALTAKQFWLNVKAKLNSAEARREIDALLNPRSLQVQIDILTRRIETGPSDASDRAALAKLLVRQGKSDAADAFEKWLKTVEGERLDAAITPGLKDDVNVLNRIIAGIRKRMKSVTNIDALNELRNQLDYYNSMLTSANEAIADANREAAANARAAADAAADAATRAAIAKPVFKPGQLKKMTIDQLERWRAKLQRQIKEAREDGVTAQERINITRWQRGLKLVNDRLNKLLERQAKLLERLAAATDRYIAGLNQMFRKLGIEGTLASSTEQLMAAIAQEAAANAKIKSLQKRLNALAPGDKRRKDLEEALAQAKRERGEAQTLQVEARRDRQQRLRDLTMRRLEVQQRIAGSYDTPGGAAARAALITAQIKPMQEEIANLEEKRAAMLAKAEKTKNEKEEKKLRQQARAIADAIYEKTIDMEEKQAEALELIRQNTGKIEQNTGKLGFEFQGQRFTDAVAMGVGV